MAVIAYTGLPRSGKSYGAVENVIIPALKSGQKVFTNIPMKNEYCLNTFGSCPIPFDIKDIKENPNWWTEVFEAGSVLVVDELWELWPAGVSINKARDEDKAFLTKHGHHVNAETGKITQVVLLTQDLAQISNHVKLLVDKTFVSTKLDAVGASKRFRIDIYQGQVSGSLLPASKKINSIYGKYEAKVYDAYISHTESEGGMAGDETRDDDRFNFLKSFKFKAMMLALFVPAFIAYKGLSEVEETYYTNPNQIEVVPGELSSPGNENSANTGAVAVPISKTSNFKFLSEQDDVYISFNMGHFPDLIYQITVENGGSYSSVFTADQLAILDYSLTPISTCAVRVTGPDYDTVVLCRSAKEKRNAIERAVSTSTD
jgi:zona occludens toxin